MVGYHFAIQKLDLSVQTEHLQNGIHLLNPGLDQNLDIKSLECAKYHITHVAFYPFTLFHHKPTLTVDTQ